jgi:hypothetical protein
MLRVVKILLVTVPIAIAGAVLAAFMPAIRHYRRMRKM